MRKKRFCEASSSDVTKAKMIKSGLSQRNTLCDQKLKAMPFLLGKSKSEKAFRFWKLPTEMRFFLLNS